MYQHVDDKVRFDKGGSSWFRDFVERRKSGAHHKRIMAQLRRHADENGFAIVLKDGREYKIINGYKVDGGLLKFTHHREGELEFSLDRVARATSGSDF